MRSAVSRIFRRKPKPNEASTAPPGDTTQPPEETALPIPKPLLAPRNRPIRLVVGLDFGTYGTGMCYKAVNSAEISTCDTWPGRPVPPYPKTATALLYRGSEPIAWGWDAWRQYSELDEKQKQHGKYHYVTNFKLALDSSSQAKFQLPPGFTAVQVIADFLRMFTTHCVQNVLADVYRNTDLTVGNIQWCLTVPAIWKDDQKDAMREAAHMADMIPSRYSDRLRMILEPEAAALHAHDTKLLRDAVRPGTTVMILDAGGGTVDLTVHTVQRDDRNGQLVLAETVPGRGGFCGATYVDWAFEGWFRTKVGEAAFDERKQRYPGEHLRVMTDWEVEKRLFKLGGIARQVPIIIPQELRYSMDAFLAMKLEEATGFDDRVIISEEDMKAFFEPCVQQIVQLANGLASCCPGRQVDWVLLAGGFCKSPYLVARLKECLPGYACKDPSRIYVPDMPESVIMRGAVLAYSGPAIITSRRLRLTYGYNVCREAGADVADDRKVWDQERGCYREDYFERLAIVGESIRVDQVVTVSLGAWAPSQKSFTVNLYTVPTATAQYLDEVGMQQLASLQVPVVSGCKDFVKVSFTFGQEEVKIVASNGQAISKPIAVRASYCTNSFLPA